MRLEPYDGPRSLDAIFDQALDLGGADRADFLDRACRGDTALRQKAEQLLRIADSEGASERDSGLFKESALLVEARHAAAAPVTLDRYKIMERIGSGGMGVVYKAVRADDTFNKIVAIKLMQIAAGETGLTTKFHAERRILASLIHPNIAQVFDAGNTAEGQPFLVMEYVDGQPIDKYVGQRKPSSKELASLFIKVCSAVGCAHRNLIVHRDLKPGNILVTAEGEPKLLDFGVAKLLDGSMATTQGGAMTPRYASPEQVRGEAINTASDIYSLGVLFYELLSGKPLYGDRTSPLDLARAIEEEPPPRLEPVDSDLRNIALMALRKEPARRYSTVQQMAEDLRRYLDGYPVIAQPDTRGYRVRKFVGRNRTALAAVAVVIIAIAAGVISTLNQARIANRRFDDLRKLANSYLFEFHDAIEKLPGATPARQLVVRRALEYLDSLSREKGNDPGLTREVALAYGKVASVLGEQGRPNLGDPKGALENFRKSLALLEPLAKAAPGDSTLQMYAANTSLRIGRLLMQSGDLKQAEANHRKAVEALEKVVGLHPADANSFLLVRRSLMDGYASLADLTGNPNHPNLGKTNEAVELYRKALEVNTQLSREYPKDLEIQDELASLYNQLGQMQQALNDGRGAVQSFAKSLEVGEGLALANPLNIDFRRGVALEARNLSLAYARLLNDHLSARRYSLQSAAIYEWLAKSDPANVNAQLDLFDSYFAQGWVLEPARAVEKIAFYNRAIATLNNVIKEHPGTDPTKGRTAYQLRADARNDLSDTAGAIQDAQTELDMDAQLLKANPSNAGATRNQAVAYAQIGKAHEIRAGKAVSATARINDWRDARDWYRKAVEVLSRQRSEGTLIPMYVPYLERASQSVARCDRALTAK